MTKNFVESIVCSTAEEFLHEISLQSHKWWLDNSDCEWVFRGQNTSHTLLPTLYRQPILQELLREPFFEKIRKLFDSISMNIDTTISNIVNKLPYQLNHVQKENISMLMKINFIEIFLTESYLLECNKTKFDVPTLHLFSQEDLLNDSVKHFLFNILQDNLLSITNPAYSFNVGIHHGFKRLMPFLYPTAYALARHHRIPSRLLDWTHDPDIAAFFSAYDDNTESNPCVWGLNRRFVGRVLAKGQVAIYDKLPRKGLEYLHEQKGLFTELVGAEAYYYQHGKWPTLDEYLLMTCANQHPMEYLKIIELKCTEKAKLLTILDRKGINHHKLMPTYDSVGLSILSKLKLKA